MPPLFSVLAATCARIVKTLSYATLARYLTAVCCFVVVAGFFFDASRAAHTVRGWLAGNTGSVESLAVRPTRAGIAPRSVTVATANGSLNIERSGHTATDLGDGKVLLVGGDDIGTAEIYDAAHGTAYYTGSLSAARSGHTATKLPDGRVLIAGGSSSDGGALAATEIYDAATGGFSAGISLKAARSGHTATVLADGRIVFIGGDAQGTAEIFEPLTGRGKLLEATLDGARAGHAAALLQNGKILIVGGKRGEADLDTAELFDTATLTFAPARNTMRGARVRPNLRVLPDGKVQVIGGDEAGSMEMFNPGGGYFTAYARLLDNAAGRAKTLRADTRSGLFHKRTPGAGDTAVGTLSEVFDRADYSLTEIPRHILVAGGVNSSGKALRSVVMLEASSATVTTDQTDYQPGEFVNITGGGWLPGETVRLTLHRDNDTPDTTLNATADADGNIANSDYLVQPSDLNVAFLVTAVGQTSGYTAQTTFTDSVNPITITAPVSASPVTVTSLPATIPITFTYSTSATGSTNAFVAVKDSSGATIVASPTQIIPTSTSTTSATINVTIPGGTANASNYSAFAQVTNAATPGTITQQDTKTSAVIVDVPLPVKLAFITSSFTAIAGQCGSLAGLPITVEMQDAGGNNAQSTTNTTVNLTSSSAGGTFYSDAQCIRAVTGVVIPNAGNSAGFYYKDTTAGTPTITAADAANGLSSATQIETIAAAPSACASPGFAAATNFTVGALPLSVAVGDFNADGKSDVVAANNSSTTVSILLGNGAGGFAAAINFTVGANPRSVAIGDFNGDGKADVVAANQSSNNVSILLGNGAGGFAAATNFAVGSIPFSVAVGDFNADGRADVVTANFNSTAVSILLNNGVGGFAAATNFTVGIGPQSVAIGDFNGDGKADIAIGKQQSSNNISLLLGNGAGGFAAATNFTVPAAPLSVAVGDFNADGKADLATANSNSNNVSILLGNGLGSFAAAVNFTVGTAPAAIAISDFNGDGKADITTGNQSSNNISILLGDGAGGFGTAANFAAAQPRSVAVGDFNADGKPDVVAAIFANPSSVSVLLNSCLSAPDLTIAKTHGGNLTIGTNANYVLTVSNAAGAAATSGTITVTDTLPTGLSFVSSTGTGWSCSAGGQNITCTNSNSLAAGASGSAITLTVGVGAGTAVGTNSITNIANVSITGETNTGNNSASDPTTVNKGNQTIAFGALADKTYGEADFAVSATASSGLAVSFAASGNCTVSGTTVHITGAGNCTLTASQAGNASYNAAPAVMQSFTINSKTLTPNITAANKVYDRTIAATILTRTLTGVVGVDDVTLTGGTATFDNKNVGTGKAVTATGLTLSGAAVSNYVLYSTTTTTTADVTPRTLNISATAQNKTYDGTTAATVTLSDDRVGGDDVTTSYTIASFADKNVGANKPVSVSGISLSGAADAGNYSLGNSTTTTTANITQRPITVTADAKMKTYGDGDPVLTYSLTSGSLVMGDVINYGGGALTRAPGENVGAYPIQQGTLTAGDNYALAFVGADLTITERPITIAADARTKIYGYLDPPLTYQITSGSLAFSDAFTGALVRVSGESVGSYAIQQGTLAAGTNYALTYTGADLSITPKMLTVAAAGINKVYDGATTASVSLSIPTGIVSGDTVGATYASASFADRNVGIGKTVSITGIALTGASAGNYTASMVAVTTADITQRALIMSATGVNKVYDGNANASAALSDDRVAGDMFSTNYSSASFADKFVGTGKAVSVSGISISGIDAGNYAFNTTANTLADITVRALTVSATGVNKVYDGNATATVNLSDNRVAGDVFTTSNTSASFNDKNVGTGKPVSVSAISISGVDAGNYTFNTTASTTADITALAITGSITAANKVYDGNTSATILTRTLPGAVSGDVVSYVGGSATFADKNVSAGKTVTATGLSLSGADAGNYTVNSTATTNADITQRTLTVTATAANKVYDGNANASVTLFDNRVAGDVQTVVFTSALFDNANIGANKTVTVSGIAISGSDAGNYMPASTVVTTTASITAAGTTMVSVSPNTVQYSDTVTFTANITPTNTSLIGQVAGTVQFCINGADFGAPVAAVFNSAGATAALTFNNQLAPGNYTVAAKFISANPNFGNSNSGNAPLTITREDARVFYNGMLFVNTTCATCSNAIVQLAATVKDITAVPGDAAFDANAGNISNATLTFVNADTNTDIATVPISLVSAGDTRVGTAVYNWSVNLGSADSSDYTIGFRVNGYYTRYAGSDAEVLTVSKPLGTNFITGGGYLVMTSPTTSSAGQYAGAPGLHTNFSFNVKYSNSGNSLQGTVNVIVRGSGGRVYQFKGNQMDTLTVNHANPEAQTAVYTGKCTLTDITDPNAPISLGEGHALQMKMTDRGEPGSTDIIGITVYANTNGALLFSSRWNGTTTIEQLLGGGNISVK